VPALKTDDYVEVIGHSEKYFAFLCDLCFLLFKMSFLLLEEFRIEQEVTEAMGEMEMARKRARSASAVLASIGYAALRPDASARPR
jgi:hypothetical protein